MVGSDNACGMFCKQHGKGFVGDLQQCCCVMMFVTIT